MTISRRAALGLAALLGGTLAAGTTAFALQGHFRHGGREAMMTRFVSSVIDEALEEAKVTDQQRAAVHAARDRVFDALREGHATRRDHLERALALFEADQVDEGQVAALHREAEARRERVADAVHQAIREAHAVLTPEQRKAVADYLRGFAH